MPLDVRYKVKHLISFFLKMPIKPFSMPTTGGALSVTMQKHFSKVVYFSTAFLTPLNMSLPLVVIQ